MGERIDYVDTYSLVPELFFAELSLDPSILPVVPAREDSKRRSQLIGVFVYADAGERTGAMVGGKVCSRHVPLLEDGMGCLSQNWAIKAMRTVDSTLTHCRSRLTLGTTTIEESVGNNCENYE